MTYQVHALCNVCVCVFRSICLLIQAALPCLMFAPAATGVVMRGGTNADKAPPIDYLLKVY